MGLNIMNSRGIRLDRGRDRGSILIQREIFKRLITRPRSNLFLLGLKKT